MKRRKRITPGALAAASRGWREAVDHSQVGHVLPTVEVPRPPRFHPLDFRGTLATLLVQLSALVMFAASLATGSARPPGGGAGWHTLAGVLLLTALVVAAIAGPRAFQVLRLYLRYLPVDGAVRGIALAVRDALVETGLLPRALSQARPIVSARADGGLEIALATGSLAERALFADCVTQVLAPIDRPRYLITRRQSRRVGRALDYHAVPAVLGSRADRAQTFLKAWRQHVSPGDLLYTRSDDGRRELARARFRAFANAADDVVRRTDRWW